MNITELKQLLESIREGQTDVDSALERLRYFPYSDLGYAVIDHHREVRTGYPEIIFCPGKTVDQVTGIFSAMAQRENNIIATRATAEVFEAVAKLFPEARYFEPARIISLRKKEKEPPPTSIGIISAGTSDMPVAEEAAVTAELLGNRVVRIYDVGVAGIHRLIDKLPRIKQCRVVVVVAGMEGALASVVGGLVDKPLIAVPTSVGYGAAFSGLSSLLTMLTSCAAGITVVNIDNGFGAGFAASRINHL
ncbi:MAG: nickel pincer cofactor biosynthesis protein LarB [Bacteroidetes bacterium]|nr:nickel pincer cofactor biosynthesis protein LarB [Bacteroidota bacterium]